MALLPPTVEWGLATTLRNLPTQTCFLQQLLGSMDTDDALLSGHLCLMLCVHGACVCSQDPCFLFSAKVGFGNLTDS